MWRQRPAGSQVASLVERECAAGLKDCSGSKPDLQRHRHEAHTTTIARWVGEWCCCMCCVLTCFSCCCCCSPMCTVALAQDALHHVVNGALTLRKVGHDNPCGAVWCNLVMLRRK